MGRQALIAVVCWLTLCEALGEAEKTVPNAVLQDSISEESAPRLYRNAPFGVYASAAPHGAFSFHSPAFISAPRAVVAGSQIVPVKQDFHNGYLKDSYGNKFVESPQSFAYKSAFPQQYVELQDLPHHLSQPLSAATPGFQRMPSHFFGSHYKVPSLHSASPTPLTHFGFSQPLVYAERVKSLASPSEIHYRAPAQPAAQQQSTNNKVAYSNSQPVEQFKDSNNGPKFQRLENRPIQGTISGTIQQLVHHEPQTASDQQQIVTTVNGKKTVITLETKPSVPLLDLTLLEPLTFDNPIVPQVQHYLPKINSVMYHKLPQPNLNDGKQRQKKPQNKVHRKQKRPTAPPQDEPPRPIRPIVTVKGNTNGPEITYEINTPNHKETVTEQKISYNKEIQSEPVHYSYAKQSNDEPVHYSYSHNSKQPAQIQKLPQTVIVEEPKHLIYKFTPEEQSREQEEASRDSPPHELEESEESVAPDGAPEQLHHHEEGPRQSYHPQAEHREEEYHHRPNDEFRHEVIHDNPLPPQKSQSIQGPAPETEYQAIAPEYDEDIRLPPTHKPNAPIKVDPDQHVQREPRPTHHPHPSPAPQKYHTSQRPEEEHPPTPHPKPHPPNAHIQEKSKRVIIQEETPDEMHSLREQMMAEILDQEENNEEEFEKSYKAAAYGFPGYDRNPNDDLEKDIYNPASYGASKYTEFEVDHAPFQQYQEDGDEYPKSTRLSYKDSRDKTKENYYLDYSVKKPETLTDRYKNKENYYKLYMDHRPEKYFAGEGANKKNKQTKAKYTAAPSYDFDHEREEKQKKYAKYKAAPIRYEYDYSKGTPRDSSAHASRPHQRYKSKTHFVEPQFQYGFEPISLPRLLDSELAAMASNDSPESEKPGTRKKIYKENWYIKKTSTSGSKPAS